MERRPEPELMDSPAQTAAYAAADFADANTLFTETFAALRSALPVHGVLYDLGCGPADITQRLARLLPGWRLIGLDAGPNMLAAAAEAVHCAPDREDLSRRIEFQLRHLPDSSLPRGAAGAVVSNSLLHHLPDPRALWQTVLHLAAPGAVVQVMDLERPPDNAAVKALVERYAGDAPAVLRDDFDHSLRAAYRPAEVTAQLAAAGLGWLAVRRVSDRHWLAQGIRPV